jgi:hypothetical protein
MLFYRFKGGKPPVVHTARSLLKWQFAAEVAVASTGGKPPVAPGACAHGSEFAEVASPRGGCCR